MENSLCLEQVIRGLKSPNALNGETAQHVELLSSISRPFSELRHARITTPTRQFNSFIKQYRLKESSEAHRELMTVRVEKDYSITQHLYERLSTTPDLHVPRPLACFKEQLTVVFEESPGENLLHYIQRHARGWPSRATRNQLVDYCGRCGDWLRQFQKILPSESRFSISEMWQYVDLRLKRLVADRRARFGESPRQRVHDYFEKLEADSGLILIPGLFRVFQVITPGSGHLALL